MQNPKNMTLLSLMLEFQYLHAKNAPTQEELKRKKELREEIKKSKREKSHA